MFLRSVQWCCLIIAIIIMHEVGGQRPVSWEALKEALREIEHEEMENQFIYGSSEDEREKRGPMNFRFRGAKRFAGDEPSVSTAKITMPDATSSEVSLSSGARPKRSPYNFRFRGAKRAPSSSGFFGMRGKKDQWDAYYDQMNSLREAEEKRGPMNFRFRGA
ncbi:hypothetical protein RvY_01759 [Ramazzottius varieornatus]|uniref:Uncharacterized protein n=1 Tax=Ramazzottius varieornatus TaxID=947166 RepID=A0A1D1UKW1_RAMVA|nr:hypothetical protein RvY_01759 [Ramazzottius varieornatus]